jgi:diacylglycerol kinase family enzyme
MLDRKGEVPERTPGIELHRAAEVEVRAKPAMRIQYDGEVLDELTPLKARSLKRAATLLVPRDCPFAHAD